MAGAGAAGDAPGAGGAARSGAAELGAPPDDAPPVEPGGAPCPVPPGVSGSGTIASLAGSAGAAEPPVNDGVTRAGPGFDGAATDPVRPEVAEVPVRVASAAAAAPIVPVARSAISLRRSSARRCSSPPEAPLPSRSGGGPEPEDEPVAVAGGRWSIGGLVLGAESERSMTSSTTPLPISSFRTGGAADSKRSIRASNSRTSCDARMPPAFTEIGSRRSTTAGTATVATGALDRRRCAAAAREDRPLERTPAMASAQSRQNTPPRVATTQVGHNPSAHRSHSATAASNRCCVHDLIDNRPPSTLAGRVGPTAPSRV